MNFTLYISVIIFIIQSPLIVIRKSWFKMLIVYFRILLASLTKAIRLVIRDRRPGRQYPLWNDVLLRSQLWCRSQAMHSPSYSLKFISTANRGRSSSLAWVFTYSQPLQYVWNALTPWALFGSVTWSLWEARNLTQNLSIWSNRIWVWESWGYFQVGSVEATVNPGPHPWRRLS